MKGTECTVGWASWVGQISEKDCGVVSLCRKDGAIFYLRTNIPQTLVGFHILSKYCLMKQVLHYRFGRNVSEIIIM